MKVALIVIGVVVVLLGGVVWLGSGPDSRVKLANEMDKYALDSIEQHHLVPPGDKLRAYFDETLKMDGTEAVILTDQHLVYFKEGRTSSLALAEVTDVQRAKDGLSGDVFTIRSKSGDSMRVEVAPLNGGDLFYDETMAAWKRAAPATH